MELRKREFLPDISYDLDGDGYVGGRDYVIGRRFDEGLKNYLTPQERQKAIEAVKNGYEDKFVWNVEASGAQRQFRIMQKRGQIVDSDDFQNVAVTYPPHPIGEFKPALKTQTELQNHRKLLEQQDIRGKVSNRGALEDDLRKVHFKDYYIPQEFVEKPKYNATWEKHEEEAIKTRVDAGLLPKMADHNPDKLPDPSLTWVYNPEVNSKTMLIKKRKEDNLKEQSKFEKNVGSWVDGQARIENREACILRLSFKGLDTVTMNRRMLKENRIKEMIEENTIKFGDQVLGVHGAELPKFAGHPTDQFYWTMQKSFNKSPRCQSQNLLQQQYKYWANIDQVKLADATGLEAPIDPFKTVHEPQKSKFNIANKVQLENHWKNSNKVGEPEIVNGWKPNLKWSEKEANLRCDGPDRSLRTMDKVIQHARNRDNADAERELKMEETIIKQAPRSLQMDVAAQLAREKNYEATLKIGANRMAQPMKSARFGNGRNA